MTMNAEFELNRLFTLLPEQSRWPEAQYVHWKMLHKAADAIRDVVRDFFEECQRVNDDKDLSPEGKAKRKAHAAAAAMDALEESVMLKGAKSAGESMVAKWQAMIDDALKVPDDPAEIAKAQEIRNIFRNEVSDKGAWLRTEADKTAIRALYKQPSYLIGELSESERATIEAMAAGFVDPEIHDARKAVTGALDDVERGVRDAKSRIENAVKPGSYSAAA